ncbi:g3379 [Coccomyxa elongata]
MGALDSILGHDPVTRQNRIAAGAAVALIGAGYYWYSSKQHGEDPVDRAREGAERVKDKAKEEADRLRQSVDDKAQKVTGRK